MIRPICLIPCLTMLCTGTAIAQEAYVYDYIPNKGVYVYDASSTGKLTPIKGSPFKPAGQMVGTNGRLSHDSRQVHLNHGASAGVARNVGCLYPATQCLFFRSSA